MTKRKSKGWSVFHGWMFEHKERATKSFRPRRTRNVLKKIRKGSK